MGYHLQDDLPTEAQERGAQNGPRASYDSSSKRQRTAGARHDQPTTVFIPILAHQSSLLEEGGGGGDPVVRTGEEDKAEEDEEGAPDAPRAPMEAICFKCFDTGARRLYSIRLAYHAREAVVENFACPGCGYYSNEILAMDTTMALPRDQEGEMTAIEDEDDESSGGASRAEPHRNVVSSALSVDSPRDLDRRIIKSRDGSLVFAEIEFEIPAVSQRGEVDTLAGFMRRAVRELSPNLWDKNVAEHVRRAIETTVTQLTGYLEGNQAFTVRLDDQKGDSFIEMFDEADRSVSLTYG